MSEKVKACICGQVVTPKTSQEINLESGSTLEIDETTEGLLLKPFNPVA